MKALNVVWTAVFAAVVGFGLVMGDAAAQGQSQQAPGAQKSMQAKEKAGTKQASKKVPDACKAMKGQEREDCVKKARAAAKDGKKAAKKAA